MAEVKTSRLLQASNGCNAYFVDKYNHDHPVVGGKHLWISNKWPLDEFDELIEFVREYKETLKQAEMQTED